MAKKKKKGAGSQDVDEMSKSELKAYHKEICAFYLENGWRETLSYYALSPAQGSEIIPEKIRNQHKEKAKEAKKGKTKAKRKGKAKEKAPKSKAKRKGKRKKAKTEDAAPPKAKKRRKSSKKRARGAQKVPKEPRAAEPDATLDFLLRYRKKNGMATIDDVIIDLVSQSRKAA